MRSSEVSERGERTHRITPACWLRVLSRLLQFFVPIYIISCAGARENVKSVNIINSNFITNVTCECDTIVVGVFYWCKRVCVSDSFTCGCLVVSSLDKVVTIYSSME